MRRSTLNYWIDLAIAGAILVCGVTGVLRLFPALVQAGSGGATLLGVPTTTWATIHDWAGVVLVAGATLHIVLHLRWLVTRTRRLLAGGRARPAAPAARPSPRAAVPRADAPVVATRVARDDASRSGRGVTRRRFLTGALVVGGGVVLGGAALRTLSDASTSSATRSDSAAQGTSDDTGDTGYGGGSSATSSARVVIDADACTGCGTCAQVCPAGVFTISGGTATADAASCRLCGRCQGACPQGAITLNG